MRRSDSGRANREPVMTLRRVSKTAINNAIPAVPAGLTEEDTAIWCVVYLRKGHRPEFGAVPAALADMRDADLMRTAQQHKGCVAHWSASRGHAALVRGWK